MSKPVAVLISDVHYSLKTLEEADRAMHQAIMKSEELKVPLIVAGDLHDTKALLRAECVNTMITTFKSCKSKPIVLVGNHDKINEKSQAHSLNFLADYVSIVETPEQLASGWHLIPYYSDVTALKLVIHDLMPGSKIIMHQGIMGSNSGEYLQDQTALSKEDLASFRVVSGHYHERQSFELPEGGRFDYIGNPYTLGFGEANHPEKGFQVLNDDGTLTFIPTNLRKHIVITDDLSTGEYSWTSGPCYAKPDRTDIVWVKIKGSSDKLSTFDRKAWAKDRGVPMDFRLDLIEDENRFNNVVFDEIKDQLELFNKSIDGLQNVYYDRKERLKQLVKDLLK